MNTLDRYLWREILTPFFVGFGLFFALVAFMEVLKVSDSVTGLGVGGGDIFQALIYSFPPLLGLLLPISGLFATLLGVGRLSADREVIALSACGISPFRLMKVPALFGVLLSIISMFAMIYGEPWGISGIKELMGRSAQSALANGIRVGEFNEWVDGVTFYARGKNDTGWMTDVLFADRRDQKAPVVVVAKRARVRPGAKVSHIVFELEEGSMLLYDRVGTSIKKSSSSQKESQKESMVNAPKATTNTADAQRLIKFSSSEYLLNVGRRTADKARFATYAQSLSLDKLWAVATNPKVKINKRALHMVTLMRKFALPSATLIFCLLAVVLGCAATRGARARGFLISAGIVGAYYYIGRAMELAARAGNFSPWLAAWVPNLIGLTVLLILLVRFRHKAV